MSRGNEIVSIPTVPIPTDVIISNQQSPPTRAEYAALIAGEWRRGVLSIIEVGRLLNSAKQTLSRPDFNGMVAADLPFPKTTTSMLRKVATRFGNVLYTEKLPPSWMTLYLLTLLPTVEFDRRLADGTINPALEQSEVRGWLEERGADRIDQPAPALKNGAGPDHRHEELVQQEGFEIPGPENSNPPIGQAEILSTENVAQPEDEVESPRAAPAPELPSNLDGRPSEPPTIKIEPGRRYELRVPETARAEDCAYIDEALGNLSEKFHIEIDLIEDDGGANDA
jgi:hypothetical protein